ncbi:transposase [Mameliella sp. AT18]|uniref:REP-associated tyrosine transposase n=1 Tax=Mameliella sp. AT18 TaxID=3028385 RepID=UPI000840FDEC|nr:transposase [Mameliella sp. AT18]MDD9731922.1 transposase [Mameliella sp. AT18]ODM48325.1 hypothetical protein A9320_18910 [Ruegeria sp. PBVC088]
MTSYRRLRLPGATYFFTVNLSDRRSGALVDHIDDLRAAWARTCRDRPFLTEAVVVLPDHLHAIWTLPPGDADFSTRWRLIKTRFSLACGLAGRRSHSKRRKGERGPWQRRFWEHAIRGEADFRTHLHFCWGNPVRHGLVAQAEDWPYSSLHRDLPLGRVQRKIDCLPDGLFGERMGEDHPSYGSLRAG